MCAGDHWRQTHKGGRREFDSSAASRLLRHPNAYQSSSRFSSQSGARALHRGQRLRSGAAQRPLRSRRISSDELEAVEAADLGRRRCFLSAGRQRSDRPPARRRRDAADDRAGPRRVARQAQRQALRRALAADRPIAAGRRLWRPDDAARDPGEPRRVLSKPGAALAPSLPPISTCRARRSSSFGSDGKTNRRAWPRARRRS